MPAVFFLTTAVAQDFRTTPLLDNVENTHRYARGIIASADCTIVLTPIRAAPAGVQTVTLKAGILLPICFDKSAIPSAGSVTILF